MPGTHQRCDSGQAFAAQERTSQRTQYLTNSPQSEPKPAWQQRFGRAPSPEALATALCDAGLVHINEPRIQIHGVSFYPSDFWPERRDLLQRKVAWARNTQDRALYVGINRTHLDTSHFRDYDADIQRMVRQWGASQFLTDQCAARTEQETNALLDRFAQGSIALLAADTPERERTLWPSDRVAAIRFLSDMPADQLEFLLRTDTDIQLNTRWNDDLKLCGPRDNGQFWHGSATIMRENVAASGHTPLHGALVVGGIAIRSGAARATLSHETAHLLFRRALGAAPPSAALTRWKYAANTFVLILRTLDESELKAFTKFCPSAFDTYSDTHDLSHSMGHLLLDMHDTYKDAQKIEEVFCNSLMLKDRVDSRTFFDDISNAAHTRIAECIAQMQTCAQAVLDEQLAQLRQSQPPLRLTDAGTARSR